ncbi:MAG: hypothetical protein Q4B68_00880 [Bacteroidales bacterium]|nr:hypothetical protein [Bacteroidales bacterium]
MTLKKIFFAAMAAIAMLGFTACGGSDEPKNPTESYTIHYAVAVPISMMDLGTVEISYLDASGKEVTYTLPDGKGNDMENGAYSSMNNTINLLTGGNLSGVSAKNAFVRYFVVKGAKKGTKVKASATFKGDKSKLDNFAPDHKFIYGPASIFPVIMNSQGGLHGHMSFSWTIKTGSKEGIISKWDVIGRTMTVDQVIE